MAQEQKGMEVLIRQVGAKLGSPPAEVGQLIDLLDETEEFLSRVDQSPSSSMLEALDLTIKSLVGDELFRHSDKNVKVAVASCISEISRITAPDAPYDDSLMKEVFQRFVEAFEKLDDTSSQYYSKRVSILETVAKVRLCVVMLDLECDALVLEMFQHFVRVTGLEYSDNVFCCMETIMSLVLEESEEICSELLSCLLNCLKKDNQDASPVSYKLVGNVFRSCAAKLKPCLIDMFPSLDSLSGYDGIVASVWQGTLEQNEPTSEHLADESKLSERTVSDELPQVSDMQEQDVGYPEGGVSAAEKPPCSVVSNGTLPKGANDGHSMVESKTEEQKLGPLCDAPLEDAAASAPDSKPNNLELGIVKSVSKPNSNSKKKKGRKMRSAIQLIDNTEHSPKDDDEDMSTRSKNPDKEACISHLEGLSVKEESAACMEENLNEVYPELPSEDGDCQPSSNAIEKSPDAVPRRRGRRPGWKSKQQKQVQKNVSSSKGSKASQGNDSRMDIDGSKDSEGSAKKPFKKTQVVSGESGGNLVVDIPSKSEVNGILATKQKRFKGGKGAKGRVPKGESSGGQKSDMGKWKGKVVDDDNVDEGLSLKEIKSAAKAQSSNQKQSADDTKTKYRRKRAFGAAMTNQKEADDTLVGCKIQVWWPDDKQYYAGMVDSYDKETKKHKITYHDGDIEILLLREEDWHPVDAANDMVAAIPISKFHPNKGVKAIVGTPKQPTSDAAKKSGNARKGRPPRGSVDSAKPRGRPSGSSLAPTALDTSNPSGENPASNLKEVAPSENDDEPNNDSPVTGSNPKSVPSKKAGRKPKVGSANSAPKSVDGGSITSGSKLENRDAESPPKRTPGRPKRRRDSTDPPASSGVADEPNGVPEKAEPEKVQEPDGSNPTTTTTTTRRKHRRKSLLR